MKLARPLGLIAALAAGPALAAEGDDPDWPCVQRKVEHMSLAVMWPHPVPEDGEPLPEELDEVAEQMALRRVPMDQVEELIADLAEEHPEYGAEEYGRLFATTFEDIDRQRSRLIRGIARYAQGQAGLADDIEALRAEFAEAEAAEDPDFDLLDRLEEEIDWRERVFDERNSALTYVCETPVLLEQRTYGIAQALLRQVD